MACGQNGSKKLKIASFFTEIHNYSEPRCLADFAAAEANKTNYFWWRRALGVEPRFRHAKGTPYG